MVNISQYMCVSSHHIVHLKLTWCYVSNMSQSAWGKENKLKVLLVNLFISKSSEKNLTMTKFKFQYFTLNLNGEDKNSKRYYISNNNFLENGKLLNFNIQHIQ